MPTITDRVLAVRQAGVRARFALLALWAVPWGVGMYPRRTLDSDWWVFEFGSRAIAGLDNKEMHVVGGALHVYEWMPRLQIGPPALVATVPFEWLPPEFSRVLAATTMVLAGLAVLGLVERIAALSGVSQDRRQLFTLYGGFLLVPAWSVLAVSYMHLDDVIALVLVVVAMHEMLRGRWITMALALGVSAATKPWAIAFFALLLMLPRARRSHSFLLAAAVAGACWLPFVVAAPDTVQLLGAVGDTTARDSTLNLLGFAFSPPGARLIQLIAMVLVACLVVRAGRWQGVLFAVVAVRLITDWQTWLYYSTALVLGAFVLDVLRGRSRAPWLTAGAAGLMVLEATMSDDTAARAVHPAQHLLAVVRIAVLLPLVVALAWPPGARAPRWMPFRVAPTPVYPDGVLASVSGHNGRADRAGDSWIPTEQLNDTEDLDDRSGRLEQQDHR